jgi:hypothetical protein
MWQYPQTEKSCKLLLLLWFLHCKILSGAFHCSNINTGPFPVVARSKRLSADAHLLGLRVRISLGTWMSVCCKCCVLSGKGTGVGLITPRQDYQV